MMRQRNHTSARQRHACGLSVSVCVWRSGCGIYVWGPSGSAHGIDMTSPPACYICFGMSVCVCVCVCVCVHVCTCELRQGQRVHTAAVSVYLLPPLHILSLPSSFRIHRHLSPSCRRLFPPLRVLFIFIFFSPVLK